MTCELLSWYIALLDKVKKRYLKNKHRWRNVVKKVWIFDCDGVLRNFSWHGVYRAYIEIARHFGCYESFVQKYPDIISFRGMCSHDWHKNLAVMGIHGEKNAGIANDIFTRVYFSQVHMFTWVPDIIAQIAQKHIVAVFSNSSEKSVHKSLQNVREYVAMILGHEQVTHLKPSPEGIYCIMKRFASDAKDVIMIGDSDADILSGKNAGVKTALVEWGATDTEKEQVALGADVIVRDPKELPYIF
ncbi:MAG: hypothetical protein CR972_00075 [Candidatus Moraniibacteriota bacterium]|nr:MAG: hypothetical protein CR972_00075 [Candidatus Moranbacteria bacterium]